MTGPLQGRFPPQPRSSGRRWGGNEAGSRLGEGRGSPRQTSVEKDDCSERTHGSSLGAGYRGPLNGVSVVSLFLCAKLDVTELVGMAAA